MGKDKKAVPLTDETREILEADLRRHFADHPDLIRELNRAMDIPKKDLRQAALAKLRRAIDEER